MKPLSKRIVLINLSQDVDSFITACEFAAFNLKDQDALNHVCNLRMSQIRFSDVYYSFSLRKNNIDYRQLFYFKNLINECLNSLDCLNNKLTKNGLISKDFLRTENAIKEVLLFSKQKLQ